MARRGGVKLILLLGGFDVFMTAEDFIEWTKNAKNRENFLTEVLGVVDKFNLQGVLFQWYYPGCPRSSCTAERRRDKENVLAMANEIFQPLRGKGLTVMFNVILGFSGFTHVGGWVSPVLPNVDFFVVESDQQWGPWFGDLDHDNSLAALQLEFGKQVSIVKNQEFLSKVLYRVRVTCRVYELLDPTNPKKKSKINQSSKFTPVLPVSEYCKLVRNPNFTKILDKKAQNFAYEGNKVISYDDGDSLGEKAAYVREKMGGFYVTALNEDDIENECGCGSMPYLRTIAEFVRGQECIYKPCF